MQLQQQVLHGSYCQGQLPLMPAARARFGLPSFAAQTCGAPRTRPVLHVQTAVPAARAAPRHLQHSYPPGRPRDAVTAFSSSEQHAREDNTAPLIMSKSAAPPDSKQSSHSSSRRSASRDGRRRSSAPSTAESGTPRHRSSSTTPGLGGRNRTNDDVSKPQHSKRAKSDNSRGVGSKRSDFDRQGRADAAGVKTRHSPARPVTGSKVSPQRITSLITAVTSIQKLQQLVHEHNRYLNHIHLAASITRLPKVQETPGEQHCGSKFQLLGQLWELLQPKLQECDTRELSNVMWAVCKLEPSSGSQPVSDNSNKQLQQEILEQLMTPFLQRLSAANAQHVSIVLYGRALRGLHLPAMQMQQLVERFLSVSHEASPQEISNTVWAVATMQQQVSADQLQQMMAAFSSKLHLAKAQEISNTLWAVATMQQQVSAGQLQQLLAAFGSNLQLARAQEISNTLWAVATMQQQVSADQLQQLLAAFGSKLQLATAQNISNTMWAVATMQQQVSADQLQQLLEALGSKLQLATAQNISNTLWAVATMQQQVSADQLQQLLAALGSKLQLANAQAVSNTLWAVATMGLDMPVSQLQQLLLSLAGKVEQATSQNAANAIWACGKLQCLPSFLLRAPQLLQKLAAARPQELANIAWALGELGHRDEHIIAAIVQQALQWEVQAVNTVAGAAYAMHVCAVCWSVSVLNMHQHASHVRQLVSAVTNSSKQWPEMQTADLRQLYQVHTWLLDFQLAGGQGLQGVLTEQQLQQCEEAWSASLQISASQTPSKCQQAVFAAIQQLPISWSEPPALEQLSRGRDGEEDGALLIDITARTAEGVLLAIEVDGPSHFRRPDGGLTGPTQYRNRALAARGYTVVDVPYHQWNRLKGSEQRQQYLMELVQQATQPQLANNKVATAAGTNTRGRKLTVQRQR